MRHRLAILSVLLLSHAAFGYYQISGDLWDNGGYLNFRTPQGFLCPVNVNNQGSVWTYCPNVNLSGVNWSTLVPQIRQYYKTNLWRFTGHGLYQGLKLIAEGGNGTDGSGTPTSPPSSDPGTPISKDKDYEGFTSKNRQLHYEGKPLYISKKTNNLVFADGTELPKEAASKIAKYYDTQYDNFPPDAKTKIDKFKQSDQYKRYEYERDEVPPEPAPPPAPPEQPEKPEPEKPEGEKPEGEKPEGEKPEGDKPEAAKEAKFCSDPMGAVCEAYYNSANSDQIDEAKRAESAARTKLREVVGKDAKISITGASTLGSLNALETAVESAQQRVDELDKKKKATPPEAVEPKDEEEAREKLRVAQHEFIKAYDTYIKSLAKRFDMGSVAKTVEHFKGQLGALVDRDMSAEEIAKYGQSARTILKSALKDRIGYKPYDELIGEFTSAAMKKPDDKTVVASNYSAIKGKMKSCSIDALAVNAYISNGSGFDDYTLTICPGYLLSVSNLSRSADLLADNTVITLPENAAGCALVFPHEIGHGLDFCWPGSFATGNGYQSGDPEWLKCTQQLFNSDKCPVLRKNMVDVIPEDKGRDPVTIMAKEILADIYGAESVALELGKIIDPAEQIAFLGKAYGLFCDNWNGVPGSPRTPDTKPRAKGMGPSQQDPKEEEVPDSPRYGTPSVAVAVGAQLKHERSERGARFTDEKDKKPVVTHPTYDARIGVILGLNPHVRAAMKCDKSVPQCDPKNYGIAGLPVVDFEKDTTTGQPAYCGVPSKYYEVNKK